MYSPVRCDTNGTEMHKQVEVDQQMMWTNIVHIFPHIHFNIYMFFVADVAEICLPFTKRVLPNCPRDTVVYSREMHLGSVHIYSSSFGIELYLPVSHIFLYTMIAWWIIVARTVCRCAVLNDAKRLTYIHSGVQMGQTRKK